MSAPRILLIGPRPRIGSPIGGAQVSFEQLVDSFRASGAFEVEVLDTARSRALDGPLPTALAEAFAFARVVASVLARGPRCDIVMFNASARGVLAGAPWIALATRVLGKRLVVRVFGGGLDEALARARPWTRWLAERTTFAADLLLLQTAGLCEHFAGSNVVRKLPTTRRAPTTVRARARRCRRFLFLAQLRPEKGIDEALRAIELAPEGCTLSVHGPLMPGASLAAFAGSSRARYLGELPTSRVLEVIAQHDALVFPSYWAGEGLPGAVIEALQCGVPVIATRWRALPELVEHGASGLLVEPRSVAELAKSMRLLASDDALYARLCAGARARGLEHTVEHWHPKLEGWLFELLGLPQPVDIDAIGAALPARAVEVHER